MKRSTLMVLLKALVSLGLLSFFLSRIDLSYLLRVLSSAHLFYLGVALAVYFFGQLISSYRWAILARALGFGNPWRDFVTFYFIGMFFNLFAPSTVGGDVGRIFYLSRDRTEGKGGSRPGSTAFATVSVLADRGIGMAVLIWIGAAALAAFPGYSLPSAIRLLTFALALGLLVGWILLPLLGRLLERGEKVVWKNLGLALNTYSDHYHILRQSILLSLFIHFLQSWMQILLGHALEVEIPWSYSLIIYPLVGTFSALPVTLNGIGLREGGYLFLLRQIDISSEKAIAFGLLWFIIIAVDSLVGGVIFVMRRRSNLFLAQPAANLQDK
jgi:uncharacterized membrane protein YbhN (UPF0104 family)